ncbi:copper resistance protein CopC [Nocardia lasii]|uniref:Copper resistance protein CopC n=1 Tax=Nocardia lasii TaxID=1616107 RepID=A0ABW1JLD0_9NOCA
MVSIPSRWARCWLLAVAFAALVLGSAGTAWAHAGLVSTSPGNGAHAAESPRELTLDLSEPVTLVAGSAQLIDSAGTRFDLATVRLADGERRLVLVPAAPLADGAYLATARVVSADTHVVSLSIQFTVGTVTEQGEFAAAAATGAEQYLNAPSKALTYLGLVLSAGLFAAARWVWPAALRTRRFAVVYRIGATVLIAGLLTRFTVLVAQQSGGLAQMSAASARELATTASGLAITAAVVLSAVALGTGTRAVATVGTAQAVAAVLAVTLGGHGGSVPGWPWSFAGTLVHVYAITVWLGGIAMIVAVVRGAPNPARWHTVAAGHLGLVVLGGLVLAWRQVRPLDALAHTTYGLVLTTKVLAVVAVAVFGALAYRRLRRSERPRTLLAESAAALVVLGLTAVLTTVPPAKDVYTTDLATTLDFGAADIVEVTIDSVRRGPQRLTLRHTATDPADPPSIRVDLSSSSANVARLPVELTPATEPGPILIWRSDRLILPAPGAWKVTVRFEGEQGPRLASFSYTVI